MQNKVGHIRRMVELREDVRQTDDEYLPQESTTDENWMSLALQHARLAASQGEVPVGAVLVNREGLLAAAGNSPIRLADPSGHAEILVLRQAAQQLQNYRLPETTLYVTLEPCIMCMGAMIQARISRLVYGTADPKTGAAISVYTIGSDQRLNHSIAVTGGVLANQCAELLKVFFRERRSDGLGKNPSFLQTP